MFLKPQHVHFVGIGGIGMSGIAEVLLSLGYQVSGSDLRSSAITDRLQKLGARIYAGHEASNVTGAKAVVVTSARRSKQSGNHGSTAAADSHHSARRNAGGADAAEIRNRDRRQPWKTTTTSMVAAILNAAGLDPTVVVGGRVAAMGGSNARIGKSQLLIVESDEIGWIVPETRADYCGGDQYRSRASGPLCRN